MPLLNIAMQGVSLARARMEPVFEDALKNANSMEAVRSICKDQAALTEAAKQSVQPCIDLLNDR